MRILLLHHSGCTSTKDFVSEIPGLISNPAVSLLALLSVHSEAEVRRALATLPGDPHLDRALVSCSHLKGAILSENCASTRVVSRKEGTTVGALSVGDRDAATLTIVHWTSGSSGTPKSVALPLDAFFTYARGLIDVLSIDASSRVALGSPLGFDPWLGDVLACCLSGATPIVVDVSLATAPPLTTALSTGRVTHFTTTPTIARYIETGERAPRSLAVLALGGEVMPTSLADAWAHRVRLFNLYGTTEECGYQAFAKVLSADQRRWITDPFPGRSFAADGGSVTVDGRPTGDLARTVAGGAVELVGRRDDQVKVRGVRLALSDVEAHLAAAPALEALAVVDDLAVLPSKQPRGGVRLLAAVQLSTDALPMDEDDRRLLGQVIHHLVAGQVPPVAAPSTVVVLADPFPRTPSGKTARRTLLQHPDIVTALLEEEEEEREVEAEQDEGGEGEGGGRAETEGLSEVQRAVAQAWRTALGTPARLRASSVFHRLGGDSLSAARVVRLLGEQFSLDVGEFGERAAHAALAPAALLDPYLTLASYATHLKAAVEQSVAGVAASTASSRDKNDPGVLRYTVAEDLLLRSAQRGLLPAVRALARTVDRRRVPALHAAAASGSVACVRCLLDVGCDRGQRDRDGQTPLHAAARAGSTGAILDLLLPHPPASPNPLDMWSRTPLHWATLNGHEPAVRWLLEHGADAAAKDKAGETARDAASRRALCAAAAERPGGAPASVFGSLVTLLGGKANTAAVKASHTK